MYLDWTKHLSDQKEREQFKREVEGARRVLDRLAYILKEYEVSLNRSETDLTTYELPNWDYRQAHKNGYRACLSRILELITLDHKETK